MKIQNLAVIFIIIVLPISIILTSYVQSQVKTLSLQTEYDAKLNNATYDAVKAFQINTINSDSSDLANSKLRDIEASVNSFFTSIANNFNMAGYNQDILKEYVPALVYTMYDGYYIYSPYTNTLDGKNRNEVVVDEYGRIEEKSDAAILSQENSNATYKQGERLSGLKPYIYYSCRYKKDDNNDVVITYSLDNYITIQGIIKGESVFDYGYLLDNIEEVYGSIKYRGAVIDGSEQLKEYLEDGKEYTYIKTNGVKYYYDIYNNKWFSILNGQRYYTDERFREENSAGLQYYKDAKKFKERIKDEYELDTWVTGEKAIDEKNNKIYELDKEGSNTNQLKLGNYSVFDFGSQESNGGSIEDPNSNFNQQRLAVIRYSIEKNLSIAIANYNNYSTNNPADFRMPKLKEDEWEKILNNVSIISFLQGLNIGGKVYNGYSIITNNKNKEVVNEESIYMITSDGQYHRPNDIHIKNADNITQGVLNIDFEIRSATNATGQYVYFNTKRINNSTPYTGCYSSIVTQTGVETTNNIYQYILNGNPNSLLAQKYYTALGRERYSMYKTNNNLEDIKKNFLVNN